MCRTPVSRRTGPIGTGPAAAALLGAGGRLRSARLEALRRQLRRLLGTHREDLHDPDRPRLGHRDLDARARLDQRLELLDRHRALGVALGDLARGLRALLAADGDRRPGRYVLHLEERELRRLLPGRLERVAQQRRVLRERRRLGVRPVAVLVDVVVRDVRDTGPDGRVVVVAVGGALEAVAVAVEVHAVEPIAVLVDPVLGDLRLARVDRRVGVVAVRRAREAVAVAVDGIRAAVLVGVDVAARHVHAGVAAVGDLVAVAVGQPRGPVRAAVGVPGRGRDRRAGVPDVL